MVKTDVMEKATTVEGRFDHIFMWYKTSNWDSLMDIFSQFESEKYFGAGGGSNPSDSRLSREMMGTVREAKYNQHLNTQRIMTEVQEKFKESMGVATDKEIRKIEKENSTVLHVVEYTSLMEEKKSVDMTRNMALKIWMELQDPSLQKSNEAPSENHDGYIRDGELTDFGKKITELVTPELQEWGRWQIEEFYPKYWPRINEVYRRKYGVDMPLNEKYSPIFVDAVYNKKGEMDTEAMFSQQNALSTAANASLIARTTHAKKLVPVDANRTLINYIDKMEFFINWTDALDFINSTFMRDSKIRAAINQNFGKNALRTVEATIKDFGRAPRDVRFAGDWINTIKNNLTVASLALKPNVFFSQLSSQPAYIDKIGIVNYVKYNPFSDWASTKEAYQVIKNSEYWKMRYGEGGGWDWTVMERMREDVNKLGGSNKWQELKNQSMFLTKYGDMFSVITGGIPVYKYTYDKTLKNTGNKKIAEIIAMREFMDITDKSQQAAQAWDLSQVQRDPILKMATMYRTAPMQYHRNITTAFRNGLLHTFEPNARRGSFKVNLRTLALYHIALPSLYQFAANGFQWDTDEQIRAAALGNFGDIFVAGDVIEGLMNSWRGLPWDYQFSPIEQTVVKGKKAAVHASKFFKQIGDEIDTFTYNELGKAAWDAAQVAGDVTGTPVAAVENKAAAVSDIIQGKTKFPVGRIIGWSESVMSGNMKDLKDNETIMNTEKYNKPKLKPVELKPVSAPTKDKYGRPLRQVDLSGKKQN